MARLRIVVIAIVSLGIVSMGAGRLLRRRDEHVDAELLHVGPHLVRVGVGVGVGVGVRVRIRFRLSFIPQAVA